MPKLVIVMVPDDADIAEFRFPESGIAVCSDVDNAYLADPAKPDSDTRAFRTIYVDPAMDALLHEWSKKHA